MVKYPRWLHGIFLNQSVGPKCPAQLVEAQKQGRLNSLPLVLLDSRGEPFPSDGFFLTLVAYPKIAGQWILIFTQIWVNFMGVDPSRYCHEDGPRWIHVFYPLKNGDNLGMVYY